MKTKLKKMLGLTALGMTLLGTTVPTWAGLASTSEVVTKRTDNYIWAQGSLVGARYSADNKQYIGCSINAAPYVVCSARDSAGRFFGCTSYEAQHVAAVQAMTDSSHIFFSFYSNNPACYSIGIHNKSGYLK